MESNSFSSLGDLMNSHLQNAGSKYTVDMPTPKDENTGGFTLMDLANQHLSQINQDKSSNLSFLPGDGKFIIPGLSKGNETNFQTVDCKPITTSAQRKRISELINQHLINEEELGSSLSSCHIEKKPDVKHVENMLAVCNINESDQLNGEDIIEDMDDYSIDLSGAIIQPEERYNFVKPEDTIKSEPLKLNVNTAPFASVASSKLLTPRLPCILLDHDYYTDIIKQSKRRYNKMKRRASSTAKAFCFVPKTDIPEFKFSYYDPYGPVKMFKFDTPSPDEIILQNLNKQKDVPVRRSFLEP